ncbi:methyltransferase domain-containing protein [Beijerinckia indica]|uniref:Methyltransferase type 11 n=1 Tax=Beijerinckia indica subsp. indica (strain ATCC 9039 / DSM 1715 / NCIMB 8712) TaxID=395963 RepID=B2IJ15_BEII9|nr:methyltransferase domain-containing protein [Beijerinckia indica]ACB94778.1 Methyltransferase type 11 [Beijerinckia indica subsp. indica ATCC 9039]
MIFDRGLIRRRLMRAAHREPSLFLLDYVVEDLCERLSFIKRSFTAIADIGTPAPVLAQALVRQYPEGKIVWMNPALPSDGKSFPKPQPYQQIVGDLEALPFGKEAFDLATSALALHYANDLPGILIQIRQSLKPDGLFLGCLLGGQTLHELRTCLATAESELCGGISPRVAPFADVRDMGGLLQRAGFALPVADSDVVCVRYQHLFALLADLRGMGATNSLEERLRKPTRRALFLRAAELYAERFSDPDGRIRATFELIYVSGWVPHESQQKPLRPGSAQMRLADVLPTKTYEPPKGT